MSAGTTAYGAAALKGECAKITGASDGDQERTLNASAFCVSQLVAGGAIDKGEAQRALTDAGVSMPSHDAANPWTAKNVGAIVRRAMKDGVKKPRQAPPSSYLISKTSPPERTKPNGKNKQTEPEPDWRVQLLMTKGKSKQTEPEPGWRDQLLMTKSKTVMASPFNIILTLKNAPAFKGRLQKNVRADCIECQPMPWHENPEPESLNVWRTWRDVDDTRLTATLHQMGIPCSIELARAAVESVATETEYDPFACDLTSLQWDHEPRLDDWLFTYCNTADHAPGETIEQRERRTKYVQHIASKFLIGLVARTFDPGCKLDCMPIFEGAQGSGKSTMLSILAGDEFFADSLSDLGSKDAAQDLLGVALVELSELSAIGRSSVEIVKGFISRRSDHYRPSYARRAQFHPRRCVFAGSTNSSSYLLDDTGGRRFWPLKVGKIDLEGLRQVRDQLLAEAVVRYRQGEAWWLDEATEDTARHEQEERRQSDPWQEVIAIWLASQGSNEFTVGQILRDCLDKKPGDRRRPDEMRVAQVLAVLGYERYQKREEQRRVWKYRRPHSDRG